MHIYYDSTEIQGSPYTINILQEGMSGGEAARRVVASGSGVKTGKKYNN